MLSLPFFLHPPLALRWQFFSSGLPACLTLVELISIRSHTTPMRILKDARNTRAGDAFARSLNRQLTRLPSTACSLSLLLPSESCTTSRKPPFPWHPIVHGLLTPAAYVRRPCILVSHSRAQDQRPSKSYWPETSQRRGFRCSTVLRLRHHSESNWGWKKTCFSDWPTGSARNTTPSIDSCAVPVLLLLRPSGAIEGY